MPSVRTPLDGRDQRRTTQWRGDVELTPPPPVRREHLVRLARRRAHAAEGDEIGLVDDDRLDLLLEGVVDLGVASSPSGSSIGGPVQASDVVALDELGECRHRVVVADDEAPAELLIEVGEAAGEEPPAVGAGRPPEAIVDDEQRDDLVALVERPPQRRVVGEPQITPEPHDPDRPLWPTASIVAAQDELLDVEEPGAESGLAAGQVEVPHPPEHVVEAEGGDASAASSKRRRQIASVSA